MKINDESYFLLWLSEYTRSFPGIAEKFDKLYAQDKERFFRLARTNSYYDNSALNDGDLLHDVRNKRIFGILLASRENELLYKKVCDIYCEFDRRFLDFMKKPTCKKYIEICKSYVSYPLFSQKNFPCHALCYLVMDREQTGIDEIFDHFNDKEDYFKKLSYVYDEKYYAINPFDKLEVFDWDYIKLLKNLHDIIAVLALYETTCGEKTYSYQVDESPFVKKLLSDTANEEDEPLSVSFSNIMSCTLALYSICGSHGISVGSLLDKMEIKKSDRENILRCFCPHNNPKKIKPPVSIDNYYIALIIYQLVEKLAEAKKFYFDNNDETLFSEVAIYRENAEKAEERAKAAEAHAKELEEQNRLLTEKINATTKQDIKAVVKPYEAEIALQQKQIEQLKAELEEERKKSVELNALRELAFEMKSEYIPQDDSIDLEDLLQGKKVAIVGGHLNWQKKMKQSHPSLIFFDGHNANVDFSPLFSCNIVLLNTAHMSHKVYYAIMDSLRKNDVPLDYLGRTLNQELQEKEIAALLQKHFHKKE